MAEETKLKSQMSDGEAVKFSDEELQSLQELQNTYASISTQFGQLKVSKMNLLRQLDSLEQSEETLENAWEDNRKKESEDQNTFDFMEEANQRGIFDDMSTRNLYEGEDLDVPAYLRRGVKIAI